MRDVKSGAPELLDPKSDLKIKDFEMVQRMSEGEILRKSIENFDCKDDPQFEKHVSNSSSLIPCSNFRDLGPYSQWGVFAVVYAWTVTVCIL